MKLTYDQVIELLSSVVSYIGENTYHGVVYADHVQHPRGFSIKLFVPITRCYIWRVITWEDLIKISDLKGANTLVEILKVYVTGLKER